MARQVRTVVSLVWCLSLCGTVVSRAGAQLPWSGTLVQLRAINTAAALMGVRASLSQWLPERLTTVSVSSDRLSYSVDVWDRAHGQFLSSWQGPTMSGEPLALDSPMVLPTPDGSFIGTLGSNLYYSWPWERAADGTVFRYPCPTQSGGRALSASDSGKYVGGWSPVHYMWERAPCLWTRLPSEAPESVSLADSLTPLLEASTGSVDIQWQALPMPPGSEGLVCGVNDAGCAVGVGASQHAFLWGSDGGYTDLQPSDPGVYWSTASAINNAGTVVGTYGTKYPLPYAAFRWTATDGWETIGAFPQRGGTRCNAVSGAGWAVYDQYADPRYPYPDPRGCHGFFYASETGLIDLNSVVPPGSGWVIHTASDITDDGCIVGTGRYNGVWSVYLMAPPFNQPPVANAGLDRTVEANTCHGADVLLDGSGSSDPDGDELGYGWHWVDAEGAEHTASGSLPTVFLPLGETAIDLTVSDGEFEASDQVRITVVDTTPPAIEPPAAVTAEESDPLGTSLTLEPPVVSDACDPEPTVEGNAPALFPLGTTTVTWTATDASGNSSVESQQVTALPGPPTNQVSNLTMLIEYAARDGEIEPGIATSLLGKLDAAEEALASGRPNSRTAARNMLQALINEVRAQRGEQLPSETADAIIERAQRLIEALGEVAPMGAEPGGGALISQAMALPTTAGAQVTFRVASTARVSVTILNVAGRPVKHLITDCLLPGGPNLLLWDAGTDQGLKVPAGTYLVHIRSRTEDGSAAEVLTPLRMDR